MQPEQRNLVIRLRTAEGHLRAVIAMIESGQPAEAVLIQLAAIQSALQVAGFLIVKNQLQRSADVIMLEPCPDQRCAELTRLINLYQLLSKHPSFHRREISEVKT